MRPPGPVPSAAPGPSAVTSLEVHDLARTNRYPELADVGLRQRWVLSRQQLREAGWSAARIQHEIVVGRWTLVAPNVVALQNAPLVHDQLLWLGVLHAGPTAVLTHATACEVGGLTWTPEPLVHVLTEKGDLVARLPGFRFHQTRRPYRDWLHGSSDLPRLRIEHAALLTAERDRRVRRAIGRLAATVQQRLTTAERLLEATTQITKLRNGRLFRLALGDIAGGAHSFAEIDVGRLCREADLQPPRRQWIRVDRNGLRRYLDCEWRLADGRVLVLEVDGSFHMRVEQWNDDLRRERSTVLSGRIVLRCSSMEVRLAPDEITRDLAQAGVPRRSAGFVCGLPA